jgi:3-oxoacyl-[acyl-carrier-protein] synthase I
VKLAGTVKGFRFPTTQFEDWTYPPDYQLSREQLRPMTPNALYAFCAMQQAIAEARLPAELVSNPRTGLMCASGGSMWMAYNNLHTIVTRGVSRCQPMAIVNSIPGSLYINLVSCFKIKGGSLGCSSACSSSSHALGLAVDLVRLGRQDCVFVVGAEDCNKYTILPFASIRALSVQTDPTKSPCAFDVKRDGFVGTGGACVLVVEELEFAKQRGAAICAEVLGWGQASDGYNVIAPDPNGDGLACAMKEAFRETGLKRDDVDYINAHATSTPAGDISESRAIRQVFAGGKVPFISSTKSLTGHGLSLAGAMEAAFCCLALQERFTPVSAHITELDPECKGLPIVTRPIADVPRIALNNSSGFGGTNVCVALRRWENGQ